MRWSLVAILPFLGGCMTALINQSLTESMEEVRAHEPEVEVLHAADLASVRRIAVMPFRKLAWSAGQALALYPDSPMQGRVFSSHELIGQLLAERFEEFLLHDRVVEVVERSRLAAVLHEQGLAQLGVTDGALPEVVAGGAGADAVLLGTLTMDMVYLPDDPQILSFAMFAVHVRLLDTRTGRILAFGRDTLGSASHLLNDEELVRNVAQRLSVRISKVIEEARVAHPDEKPPQRSEFMQLGQPESGK